MRRASSSVCTQGRGDAEALASALHHQAAYVAFVGSTKKADALRVELIEKHGLGMERLADFKAPAGLDLGAITPDEIALSIWPKSRPSAGAGSGRRLSRTPNRQGD